MIYFVATPIGNLQDMTYRAVDVLKNVDVIACEDTRHSKILLNYYDIKKPLVPYHKFNEKSASDKIISLAFDGKDIAVITDAGMPLISDPGYELVKMLVDKNIPFTVVPGACACVTALAMSGYNTMNFSFVGFLPDKKTQAKKLCDEFITLKCPLVFYTAPHDIDKTISWLNEFFGDRKAVILRELTKVYEQRLEINLKDGYAGEKRGEFVIVLEGNNSQKNVEELTPIEQVKLYEKTMSKMDAIKLVARERNMKKNDVYKMVIGENAE